MNTNVPSISSFAAFPLITSFSVMETPDDAIQCLPPRLVGRDDLSIYQRAALAELSRFGPDYYHLPHGEARETAITIAASKARAYLNEHTGTTSDGAAGFSPEFHEENLRLLLIQADLMHPSLSKAEHLERLASAEYAISFAAQHVEGHEAAIFLQDWLTKADLTPWLDAAVAEGRLELAD